ncbi:MAG TPA: DUF971 domain-containing protein [Burkholderiaceae bacterium]|nr:DUF971 domain-containing protein [Burkholderiaceae bacterium]
MAGSQGAAPTPSEINLHAKSRVLEIAFDDGKVFRLPFEFLRVFSPSAEVKGHGPGQETLQVGKRDVTITRLEPVGYYAVQPVFSDGHATGIYSWHYLYELGVTQEKLWAAYLERLQAAGASRDPDDPRNAALVAASGPSCGHH